MSATGPSNAEGSSSLQIAQLGYQTTASLVGLVSQEIYSRFGAMLIVHGLLLSAVFLAGEDDDFIRKLACFAGLLLCPLWLLIMEHGFFFQRFLRQKAAGLEKEYFRQVFTVFYSADAPQTDLTDFAPRDTIGKRDVLGHLRLFAAKRDVERYFILVVVLFLVVYVVMLSWLFGDGGSGVASVPSPPVT